MANAVTGTAVTYCIFGSRPSVLLVPNGHNVQLAGNNRANVADRIPIVNILPFGLCASPFNPAVIAAQAPVPCIPLTPAPWYPGDDTIMLEGKKGLDNLCLNMCIWRGVIAFLDAGQSDWNVDDSTPPAQKTDTEKQTEEMMQQKMQEFTESDKGKAMIKAVEDFKNTAEGKEFMKSISELKDGGEHLEIIDVVKKVNSSEAGQKLIAALRQNSSKIQTQNWMSY